MGVGSLGGGAMGTSWRGIALGGVVAAGVLGGVLLWSGAPSTPPAVAGVRPPVIVIVIETLRADHLGLYGHGRDTSPVLGALAQEALVFEKAITAAPWTLPSVSSILTGTSPGVHGVHLYEDVLPDEAETLAERFKAAGYETAFFGVNSLFEADRHLEQGFDTYYGIDEIPGTQLNEQLAAFLRHRDSSRPPFIYAHYFEPHCRYEPPEGMREMYYPPPPALATGRSIDDTRFRTMHECFHLKRRSGEPIYEIDYYLAEYDAEIRYVDHLVGLFLERLKTAGLYDDGLVVITGDHGEEFWEQETFGHGRSLNEAAIWVPLMVKPPGGVDTRRVRAPVSTLDIAPTALTVAGLPRGERMQGRDLSPLWTGAPEGDLGTRPVFSETDYEGHRFRSVHQGNLKLVLPLDGAKPRLFDLSVDPSALQDLAPNRPDEVARLLKLLDAHAEDSRKKSRGIAHGDHPLAEDVIERLKALGYTF